MPFLAGFVLIGLVLLWQSWRPLLLVPDGRPFGKTPQIALICVLLLLLFLIFWVSPAQLGRTRNPHSFNAVFDANVQVYFGRAQMCDGLSHLYGLYPHFLEPIFRVTGLTVERFSIVMLGLNVAIFVAIYWIIAKYVREPLWSFGTWLVVLYLQIFLGVHLSRITLHTTGALPDVYYQFYPVRMVFPAMFFVMLADDRWLGGRRWWLAQAMLAVGVLWNLDLGLPTWISWQMVLWFHAIARNGLPHIRRWLSEGMLATLSGLLALALAVSLFHVYITLRYGQQPDWSLAVVYQPLYLKTGYFMVPMPLWGVWQVVLFVYAIGLIVAMYGVLRRDKSARTRITFGLSVFGCGLFPYYNGRSLDAVLVAVLVPALILVSGLLRQWIAHVEQTSPRGWHSVPRWILLAPLMLVLAYCGSALMLTLPDCLQALTDPIPEEAYRDELALIAKWRDVDPEFCIVSRDRSGIFQLAIGRPRRVSAPSLVECLLVDQFAPWSHEFVDRRPELIGVCRIWVYMNSEMFPGLLESYEVIEGTPDRSLAILRRR